MEETVRLCKFSRSAIVLLILIGVLGLRAEGAIIVFTDRGLFNSAAPGLPVEGFELATIPDGDVAGIPAPLNSSSSNAYFTPGSILGGISFSTSSTHMNDEIAIVGAGFMSNPSKLIVANYYVDSFRIDLNPGVMAIGFDVHSFVGSGPVDISLYSPGSVLLGTYQTSASPAGVFWGAISTADAIGSVVLTDRSGGAEGVDNVAFGMPGGEIPEPSTLGLTGAALAGIFLWLRRRG